MLQVDATRELFPDQRPAESVAGYTSLPFDRRTVWSDAALLRSDDFSPDGILNELRRGLDSELLHHLVFVERHCPR